MIGTSLYQSVSCSKEPSKRLLLKESWHKIKQVLTEMNTDICYSYYDSYVIESWVYKDSVILFEGCIYNLSDEEIRKTLNDLSLLESREEIKRTLTPFVDKADGDYLITIYNKRTKRFIVFNDILGGMAVNYIVTSNQFILSRSLSFVVVNCSEAILSKENMAEYVMFGYNINDHTLYNNIKKLTPGSCIITEYKGSKILADVFNVIEPSFRMEDKYNSKKEAVHDLCNLFLESCKDRVEYAQKNGFYIVNTMSGGCDSRTILGGIEKYTQDYTNLTYEYKVDESSVAQKVLKHMHSRSKYIKLSFENIPYVEDSRLAFETDGKIEGYTNSICYNDIKYAKLKIFKDTKLLYFGGFGGEFIRHPMKPLIQSPEEWGLSFYPSVKFASKIFGCSVASLNNSIREALLPHSSFGREILAKFHYNEYYQNYVRCSGEERTRMFFFTVQPMMANKFIRTIRNRVPLHWAGFRFYRDFLKEIDKRLVEVELYGNAVNIKSNWSMAKRDFKQNFTLFQFVRYLQRKYTHHEYKEKSARFDFTLIKKYYDIISEKDLLDIRFIETNYKSLGELVQMRLLAILQFISECESYSENNS